MVAQAQYVTLGVAQDVFAVPVEQVREILEMRSIARLPHTPRYFLGMIDVRGQGVPVIELRAKLGLPPGEDDHSTRILVLQVMLGGRELILGVKTDRVFEVTMLDSAQLERPPEIGVAWRRDCIAGVGRRNGGFVTVLDLEALFASEEGDLIALAVDHAA